MKNLGYLVVCVLIGSAVAFQAVGADSPVPGACMDEAKKICPDMKMGSGLGQCIQKHQSDFSQDCQDKFKEAKAKMMSAIHDCKGDVKKFCSGVKPGGGKILECLISSADDLSPACKAHVDESMAKMKGEK